MIEAKRKPGRPRLEEGGEAKGVIFSIRVSRMEREELAKAAAAEGAPSASEWARDVLLAKARQGAGQ